MHIERKKWIPWLVCGIAAWLLPSTALFGQNQPHVINVIADKDSRYRVPGQRRAEIVVKAGEPVLLRVEARKGKTWNRDGMIHGFTLLRAKDHAKVPGWNLELEPGTQEFSLTAPVEPGDYEVVCTVICSDDHEGMRMKFIVVR